MQDFLKRNLKFIIIFVLILIVAIVIIGVNINNKKAQDIDVYNALNYNYFVLYSNEDLAGVINSKGEILIDPIYQDVYIPNSERDVFFCFKEYNDYEILNEKGEEVFTDYENVSFLQTSELNQDFEKYVLSFEKDGKFGLINFDGDVVLSADYDSIQSLKNKPGEILIEKNGKYGVCLSNGEIKIKVDYDSIVGDEYYTESDLYRYAGYIVGNKTDSGMIYGYLDSNGKSILDLEYESISRVLIENAQDYYLIVMNNGQKGVYKNSKELIEMKYQVINYTSSSNVFVVRRNDKYGIYSISGKVILDTKYLGYQMAGEYILMENSDGEKELYDVNGNLIDNLNYTSVQPSGNSKIYIVLDEDGYYSIIGDGDQVSDNYTYVSYAFDNYFIYETEDDYFGLLNYYSGVVIDAKYTFMLVIDGKSAIEAVAEDGTIDIYSKDLEKTVSIQNAVIETIDEDYAMIYTSDDIKYIDDVGNIVDSTDIYGMNSIYAYKDNDKWGFKNKDGEIVVSAVYDFVTELNEYGFAGVYCDGKWGVVNENGEMILDCVYYIDSYYMPSFVGKYLLEYMDTFYCVEL